MQRITLALSASLAFGLALAGPARAQPFSQSMAQCAGLYGGLTDKVTFPDRKATLRAFEAIYYEAALNEAQAEGQSDPETWVDTHYTAAFDDWAERPLAVAVSQDFIDWAAYCAKFAKSRGIDLPATE